MELESVTWGLNTKVPGGSTWAILGETCENMFFHIGWN